VTMNISGGGEHTPAKETAALAVLLFFAVLIVSLPALVPGHDLVGHDILCHLNRIEGIREGLLSGQFPVRLSPNQIGGYGMPTGIFYPDLFLYVPAVLYLCGVPLVASWHVFLVMVNVLTAAASWWAFSKYTRSQRTGAIATLFYLVFLYRLVDMYARAAEGEMLAMAFLPAALLSVWMTLRRDTSYWPAVTLFLTGILQSHIITGLVIVVAAVVLAAVSYPRLRVPGVRWAIAKAAGMTFLLNIWFYAPLLYVHTHMDYMMKDSVQGSIAAAIRPLKSMDYYMGRTMLYLLAVYIIYLLCSRQRRSRVPLQFWGLMLLAAAFIGLTVFPAPWQAFGGLVAVLQFPFRLAMFPAVLIPLALAISLSHVRRLSVIVLCACICLGGNFFWLVGNTYRTLPDHFKTPQDHILAPKPVPMIMLEAAPSQVEQYMAWGNIFYTDYADSAVDREVRRPGSFFQRKVRDRARDLHPADRITDVRRQGADFVVTYQAGAEEHVQLPVFWYIGYDAEGTAGDYQLQKDGDGQVSIVLPPEAGTVHVWYRGLPWFRVTDAVSLVSLLGFCIILYRVGRKEIA